MVKTEEKKEEKKEPEIKYLPMTPQQVLKSNVALLDKAVKTKDTRLLVGRVLRQTASIRKTLEPSVFRDFLNEALPSTSRAKALCLPLIEQLPARASAADTDAEMMTDDAPSTAAPPAPSDDKKDEKKNAVTVLPAPEPSVSLPSTLPEVECMAYLLAVMMLVDAGRKEEARGVATAAVEDLQAHNRRTLDVLSARLLHYYAWTHEAAGMLPAIRPKLHQLHRTATLRHDEIGQETLLNLLLRSYLSQNLYGPAEALRSRAQVSETSRSSQQHCRYLYYLGRIRTVQLSYSEAKECFLQAARKCPEGARGFKIAVNKWLVLIRLLLGEVPNRTEFTQGGLGSALTPYFEITQAVRLGDLALFRSVADRFAAAFAQDQTHLLITRLRHNVIRTGLKRISVAYSRIALADVSAKLGLAAGDDVELIVAKAVRDGAIEAHVDHEGQTMLSKAVVDIYGTAEPQSAFHSRVAFCLDLHNEAVRAMRYDLDAPRVSGKAAEGPTEEELASAIDEMDADDF